MLHIMDGILNAPGIVAALASFPNRQEISLPVAGRTSLMLCPICSASFLSFCLLYPDAIFINQKAQTKEKRTCLHYAAALQKLWDEIGEATGMKWMTKAWLGEPEICSNYTSIRMCKEFRLLLNGLGRYIVYSLEKDGNEWDCAFTWNLVLLIITLSARILVLSSQ